MKLHLVFLMFQANTNLSLCYLGIKKCLFKKTHNWKLKHFVLSQKQV